MNQLDKNQKKVMGSRIKVGLYLFGFIFLFLILGIFADKINNWTNYVPDYIKGPFAGIIAILSLIPLYYASFEVTKIFFKKDRKLAIIAFIITSLLVLVFDLFICLNYYYSKNLTVNYSDISCNTLALITFGVSVFIIFVMLFIYFSIYRNTKAFSYKDFWLGAFLQYFIYLVTLAFFYIVLVKSWVALTMLLIIVCGTDIFAYFGGSYFGKHLMCPKISPKKTWEGAGIALVATLVLSLIVLALFNIGQTKHSAFSCFISDKYPSAASTSSLDWFLASLMIIFLIGLSMVGDLGFSIIKRKKGIKDFSNVLKEHGGILDRLDSLGSCMIVYMFISWMMLSSHAGGSILA